MVASCLWFHLDRLQSIDWNSRNTLTAARLSHCSATRPICCPTALPPARPAVPLPGLPPALLFHCPASRQSFRPPVRPSASPNDRPPARPPARPCFRLPAVPTDSTSGQHINVKLPINCIPDRVGREGEREKGRAGGRAAGGREGGRAGGRRTGGRKDGRDGPPARIGSTRRLAAGQHGIAMAAPCPSRPALVRRTAGRT